MSNRERILDRQFLWADCPTCGRRRSTNKAIAPQRPVVVHEDSRQFSTMGLLFGLYRCCKDFGALYRSKRHHDEEAFDEPTCYVPEGGKWHWIGPNEKAWPVIQWSRNDQVEQAIKEWLNAPRRPLRENLAEVGSCTKEGPPGPAVVCFFHHNNLGHCTRDEIVSQAYAMERHWGTLAHPRPHKVVVVDATSHQVGATFFGRLADECWQAPAHTCNEANRVIGAIVGATDARTAFSPMSAWSHPGDEGRKIFRRTILKAFGKPEPTGLPRIFLALRAGKRRWWVSEAAKFVQYVLDFWPGAEIILQAMPRMDTGLPAEMIAEWQPLLQSHERVTLCLDEPLERIVELALTADYCVIAHGTGILWSWISQAPTLELMPQMLFRTQRHWGQMPNGANVISLPTDGCAVGCDYAWPDGETVFRLVQYHYASATT